MKRIFIVFLAFLSLISLTNLIAQEKEKTSLPTWLVVSQNMVDMVDVEKVNGMIDSMFVPIMEELVNEGKIFGWGQFNHAWGDEWNLNLYYITESHSAFVEFWNEFMKRVREKFGEAGFEMGKFLKAHKDNMYFIRHMSMPTPK